MNLKRSCYIFLSAMLCVYGGYNLGRSLFGSKQGLDFAQYYVASRLITDGKGQLIYDSSIRYQEMSKIYGVEGVFVNGSIQDVTINAYPPFVSFFMIPFSLFPYNTARYIFFVFSVISMCCTIHIAFSNRKKERKNNLILVGYFTTFIFFPIYYSLYAGQINALLLLCFALALFFIRKHSLWIAGFFIALASIIKLFPIVLLIFFAMKRQYKLIGTTAIFIALLIVISMILCSPSLYITFITDVLPAQFSGGPHVRNQGFVGFFTRLLTQNKYTQSIGDFPNISYILALTLGAVVMSVAILCTRREKDSGTFRYDLEYGMYFVAIMLTLAKSWEHYAIFLLFSYMFIFEFFIYEYYRSYNAEIILFALAISFCIWVFVLNTGYEYEQLTKTIAMNLVSSSKFFATLILMICNIRILCKKEEITLLVQANAQSL